MKTDKHYWAIRLKDGIWYGKGFRGRYCHKELFLYPTKKEAKRVAKKMDNAIIAKISVFVCESEEV